MNNKKMIKGLLLYMGIPILLFVVATIFFRTQSADTTQYSEVLSYFQQNKVEEFQLDLGNGALKMKIKGQADEFKYAVPNITLFVDQIRPYIDPANDKGDNTVIVPKFNFKPAKNDWFTSMLPTVILLLVLILFYFFVIRKFNLTLGESGRQMSFSKAKIKQISDEKRKTTFADVAGADEEKDELREIVEFLKNPKKYNELGARIPKGVLLVGPPGTGKTLLARAVAGEAGVPFFSISGSDFVEMFVGVGASRVRDLFEQAKKNSPCIIFIDEIDAVGRQRGTGLGGGHDEREQTLNQLLVEMDGFGTNEGVVMIAATNRSDVLDPALMRPGRFDRQIAVGYPDIKGREEILKVHAKGKPLAPDVVLKTIAQSSAGFTGADLENLLNEAALLAARRDLKAITMNEIEEATIKVVMGIKKKSRVITDKAKKLTAYHEAGHAVVTYYCPTQDPVHQISIIPRGMAGGYTMSLPSEDKTCIAKQEIIEHVQVYLGGRAAEAIVLGDISTGASNDIEMATKAVHSMVMKYGMSDKLGPVAYGSDDEEVFLGRNMGHVKNYSEKIAAMIDDEIYDTITNCYAAAENILKSHMDQLHNVARYLFLHEQIDGKKFIDIMENGFTPEPDDLPIPQ